MSHVCGIAGIYGASVDLGEGEAVVRRMLARLERRGPDDEGIAVESCAVLGNRRLAILDLTPAGHQPMVSATGRFVVTFNGEIYNFRELATELRLGRDALHSGSDTEVLLHAWERWGPDALSKFVGQWAFSLYDRATKRLWLTRDRFGEKPLFYHTSENAFAFASSVEALLEAPSVPRKLNLEALAEYATLRYVVSPRTVVEGVRKLEGGHLLMIDPQTGLSSRPWYLPPFRRRHAPRPTRHESTEQFDAVLRTSCARCVVSDRPVGLLLSDGIDSNAILAALPDSADQLTCFTFRIRGGDSTDVPAPVRISGRRLVDVEVNRADLASHVDEYCSSLTEPVGDMAALATWEIIRSARAQATVFLCGHGGDEILGGYRLSQDLFRLAALHRVALLPASWMGRTIDRHLNGAESPHSRWLRLRHAAPEGVPGAVRFLIDRPTPVDLVRELFGGAMPNGEAYLATIDQLYASCHRDATALDAIQQVLTQTFMSANILSWADSVAMSSSSELRMPYLDRDLVDFAAQLPDSHRVPVWPGRSNTKRVLRDWARPRLPADIVKRRKKGFQAGSLEGLLCAVPGTVRARLMGSPALRRALPGLEGWLMRLPQDCTGAVSSLLWTLLVLASWCEAREID